MNEREMEKEEIKILALERALKCADLPPIDSVTYERSYTVGAVVQELHSVEGHLKTLAGAVRELRADLAAAEERGRREIADIVINAVLDIETTPQEHWPSARDLLAKLTQDCGLQSEVFPLLNMCRAKEAGE